MGFHFLASCKTLFPFKIGVHCSATQITEINVLLFTVYNYKLLEINVLLHNLVFGGKCM